MSYSDFTLTELKSQFQLCIIENHNLFQQTPRLAISTQFATTLQKLIPLALAVDTEKARSEWIVAPLLAELKFTLQDISLFSGIEFNIDPAKGLNGRCDFIISKSTEQFSLNAPVLVLVEAKNDNIKSGIGQCGAEMVAAQQFNQTQNNAIDTLYGCVTTGTNWRFLQLHQHDFYIDAVEHYIENPEKIMGILQFVLTSNPSTS